MIRRFRCWICFAGLVPAEFLLSMPAAIAQPVAEERVIYEHPKSATAVPAGRVAELVAGLSDHSSERRQGAAQALLEMGPSILPQLQGALRREESAVPAQDLQLGGEPGAQGRMGPGWLLPRHPYHELGVLVSRLHEQRHSAGSPVTLRYKNAPLTDVLRDLGRQTEADIKVVGWNGESSLAWVEACRATVDVEGVTFWKALRAIQQDTGVGPVHYTSGNHLMLEMKRSSIPLDAGGSVVSGPFLIVPIPAERGVGLTLQAFVEPRLRNTGEHARVQLDECVDEHGRSLLPTGPRMFASSPLERHWTWKVPVDFPGVEPGLRLRTIKGRFSVGVGPPDRIMTLTPLARSQGTSIRLDGVEILFKQMTQTGSRYRIDIEASAPAGSPFTLTFSTYPGVHWWDDSRRTMRWSTSTCGGVRREAEREIASWTFVTGENEPVPATLSWKPPASPAETRWFTVPFELHDLTLTPKKEK